MSANQEFSGKTALITGGARNIGLAIARDLATRGASIAIADICRDLETVPYTLASSDDLEKSVAELTSSGVKAIGLTCDVRDENQVSQAVKRVIDEFGKLDILVNNAGVVSLFSVDKLTEKAWNEVLDVCLKGSFFAVNMPFHI
jgi:NAD(P)-dependent dehydrogenase (short-subunit alcohol dehydrogenase family)